ncbi:hypothetical protein WJX72_011372 [[Myrmecia] bisecta]|uniref:Uncharacterized protein n=1 Tax=[Myrmecia] bisecta TaxID=41462 RepID=A0AAW1PYW4_9CHLO
MLGSREAAVSGTHKGHAPFRNAACATGETWGAQALSTCAQQHQQTKKFGVFAFWQPSVEGLAKGQWQQPCLLTRPHKRPELA